MVCICLFEAGRLREMNFLTIHPPSDEEMGYAPSSALCRYYNNDTQKGGATAMLNYSA